MPPAKPTITPAQDLIIQSAVSINVSWAGVRDSDATGDSHTSAPPLRKISANSPPKIQPAYKSTLTGCHSLGIFSYDCLSLQDIVYSVLPSLLYSLLSGLFQGCSGTAPERVPQSACTEQQQHQSEYHHRHSQGRCKGLHVATLHPRWFQSCIHIIPSPSQSGQQVHSHQSPDTCPLPKL